MEKEQRVFLTAVSIQGGIITVLNEDGCPEEYLQLGIRDMDAERRLALCGLGLLSPRWRMVPELPKHIEIAYEDDLVAGARARRRYPDAERLLEAVYGKK